MRKVWPSWQTRNAVQNKHIRDKDGISIVSDEKKNQPPGIVTASPSASARRKRILVVDDNVDSAEMMRTMLQSVGHEVTIAHDGAEALAVAQEFSPEIALLDIGLPVMDGYELGKRLHATTTAARCRLIALTGYGQEQDRALSQSAGFEAHLVKPIDMSNLLQLIAVG
jgi:CheY-like chemotaxis protein